MRNLLASAAIVLLAAVLVPAADITGDWQATLQAGPQRLRLALHIRAAGDGLSATLDSLDQGATGLPVNQIALDGDTLTFRMTALGASFTGTVAADANTIEGTFTQGGASFPLKFEPVAEGEEMTGPPRPQMPKPPYPYDVREVAFPGGAAAVTLAGTLTVPSGDGPFPAVVLASGSGPQDRDETIAGHKPFLVLADHLSRKGIAVLRYDDRGIGASTGEYPTATTSDFARDAAAALAYLRAQDHVAAAKAGIVGHSEGALEAIQAALGDDPPSFLVLLAGSGVTGDRILLDQARAGLTAAGAPPAMVDANIATRREFFAAAAADPQPADLRERFQNAATAFFGRPNPPAEMFETQFANVTSPWMREFLRYDPAADLANVAVPVLALFGELDTQVDPALNEPPVRAALEDAPAGSRVEVLDGMNHLFQEAHTGSVAEYATIEQTMSPRAMDLIAGWILDR